MDCDDKKVILLLDVLNSLRENLEEIIVHEWIHIKMYPLDQVSESLILNCFLLEYGDNKEFSFGRC